MDVVDDGHFGYCWHLGLWVLPAEELQRGKMKRQRPTDTSVAGGMGETGRHAGVRGLWTEMLRVETESGGP